MSLEHQLVIGLLIYALILVLAYPIITNTPWPFCRRKT